MTTKERLAFALRTVGLEDMAQVALGGRYDDYESESATPKLDLVRDLIAAAVLADDQRKKKIQDLAIAVQKGDYDNTSEEADAWAARQTDPEIIAMLRQMKRGG